MNELIIKTDDDKVLDFIYNIVSNLKFDLIIEKNYEYTPNAETIKAINEAREGKVKKIIISDVNNISADILQQID